MRRDSTTVPGNNRSVWGKPAWSQARGRFGYIGLLAIGALQLALGLSACRADFSTPDTGCGNGAIDAVEA